MRRSSKETCLYLTTEKFPEFPVDEGTNLFSTVDDLLITASRTASGIHSSDAEIIVGDLVFWLLKKVKVYLKERGKGKSLYGNRYSTQQGIQGGACSSYSFYPTVSFKCVKHQNPPAGSSC
jgi:hypothetical protein